MLSTQNNYRPIINDLDDVEIEMQELINHYDNNTSDDESINDQISVNSVESQLIGENLILEERNESQQSKFDIIKIKFFTSLLAFAVTMLMMLISVYASWANLDLYEGFKTKNIVKQFNEHKFTIEWNFLDSALFTLCKHRRLRNANLDCSYDNFLKTYEEVYENDDYLQMYDIYYQKMVNNESSYGYLLLNEAYVSRKLTFAIYFDKYGYQVILFGIILATISISVFLYSVSHL